MNAFEQEFSKSCRDLGIYNIRVSIAQKGPVKLKCAPYDYLSIYNKKPIAFELKSQRVHGSFPLSNIQAHQIDGLNEMIDIGCRSYLLFNMRREQRGKKLSNRNMAWGIDMRDWKALVLSLPPINGKPRQSIPREFFDHTPFVLIPRVKPTPKSPPVWDVRELLNSK